jgi:hypothetical protein
LCQYDRQILLINKNVASLNEIASKGFDRLSENPDDRQALSDFMDSMIVVGDLFDKALDQGIKNLEGIKSIDDRSQLMSRSLANYKEFSVFLKKDFKTMCVEGKDSLIVSADWRKGFTERLSRMINIVNDAGNYQGDFQDQFAFTEEEIKAIEDCTKK